MKIALAYSLVAFFALYLGIGVIFAVPFVLRGVQRIDPMARDSSRGFRWIILPGVVALWPLLARRWLTERPPPPERNTHRDAARESAP